jgi:uncharacterized membrane protein
MRGLRASSKILIVLSLTILLTAFAIVHAQSTTIDDAQNSIYNAYKIIVDAYNSGVNTGNLIDQLNQAINLSSQAEALINSNPQQAQALALQAKTLAQNVTAQAVAAKETGLGLQPIILAVSAAALIIGGCLVYLYGPGIFWKAWLKIRKNYHVRAKNSSTKNRSLVITGEQICAVVLGITVIIAFFVTAQFFLPKGASEQFSELGILGPNMKLGDYPSEIVASQSVYLHVYVGDQMGTPMYYDVMVKLGDNTTTVNPAPIAPIQEFSSIVPNNGTWSFPVNITLTQVGLNQRIIFELWIYNQTLNQMQYHERWSQVWLNVTAPAS